MEFYEWIWQWKLQKKKCWMNKSKKVTQGVGKQLITQEGKESGTLNYEQKEQNINNHQNTTFISEHSLYYLSVDISVLRNSSFED